MLVICVSSLHKSLKFSRIGMSNSSYYTHTTPLDQLLVLLSFLITDSTLAQFNRIPVSAFSIQLEQFTLISTETQLLNSIYVFTSKDTPCS